MEICSLNIVIIFYTPYCVKNILTQILTFISHFKNVNKKIIFFFFSKNKMSAGNSNCCDIGYSLNFS